MTLKIISAERVLFQGEAAQVTLPGDAGSFTVLPHHASLVSTLAAGRISYRVAASGDGAAPSEADRHFDDIKGGIVDVDRDVVSVCVY